MKVKVRIPTPLRKITAGEGEMEIEVAGKTIADLVENLEKTYPGLKERLYDEKGQVRRFLNIYVNEEDIRFLQEKETILSEGDQVSIIPAIAGGTYGEAEIPHHIS